MLRVLGLAPCHYDRKRARERERETEREREREREKKKCIYIYKYIYIYIQSQESLTVKTPAIKNISHKSPPAATYTRPGVGLYIQKYKAGIGSCVHEPLHHIFRSFVGQHRKMGCCPPAIIYKRSKKDGWYRRDVFRPSNVPHTHTHAPNTFPFKE